MKIEFDVRVWRNYYDQINILGQYLKNSRPDWEGNPPKFKISLEERHKVEREIAELMNQCDKHLDKTNMHPKEPKWYYDRNNETTWVSSKKFAFTHLLPRQKYATIRIQ